MSTTQKGKITDLIQKYFSYPMLLLTIVLLLDARSILGNVIRLFAGIFKNPMGLPNSLLALVTLLAPVALLVLLFLQRLGKMADIRLPAAIVCAVYVVGNIRSLISSVTFLIPVLATDFYTMYTPLLSFLYLALKMLTFALLAVLLFKKDAKPGAFRAVCVLHIGVVLFFGILNSMIGQGSILSAAVTTIYVIALWYVPAVVENTRAAEITAGKGKVLMAIACVVLVVAVGAGMATGSSSSSGSGSKNTCGYCGRSWSAGDSGGNYMNIARTGMCNNCENNYHSLKDFLN